MCSNLKLKIQLENNTTFDDKNKNIYNIRRKVLLDKQEYLKTIRDNYIDIISGAVTLLAFKKYMGFKFRGKKITLIQAYLVFHFLFLRKL